MDMQETNTSFYSCIETDTAKDFILAANITEMNMLHNVIHSMVQEALKRKVNKDTIKVRLSFPIYEALKMEYAVLVKSAIGTTLALHHPLFSQQDLSADSTANNFFVKVSGEKGESK